MSVYKYLTVVALSVLALLLYWLLLCFSFGCCYIGYCSVALLVVDLFNVALLNVAQLMLLWSIGCCSIGVALLLYWLLLYWLFLCCSPCPCPSPHTARSLPTSWSSGPRRDLSTVRRWPSTSGWTGTWCHRKWWRWHASRTHWLTRPRYVPLILNPRTTSLPLKIFTQASVHML